MSGIFSDLDDLTRASPSPEPAPAPKRRVARFLGDDDDDLPDFNFDVDDIAPNLAETSVAQPAHADQDEVDVGKKKRAPKPKIDEERLLGSKGFPALLNDAKRFKFGSKGQEADDLKRLLTMYQLWAHQMFPATNFHDTVHRIEVVCRKRPMAAAFNQMKREAAGIRVNPAAADRPRSRSASPSHRATSSAPQATAKHQASEPDDEFPELSQLDEFAEAEAAMAEYDAEDEPIRKKPRRKGLALEEEEEEDASGPSDAFIEAALAEEDAQLERLIEDDMDMAEQEAMLEEAAAAEAATTGTPSVPKQATRVEDEFDGQLDDDALMEFDM